jgi:hypothetical protein
MRTHLKRGPGKGKLLSGLFFQMETVFGEELGGALTLQMVLEPSS